MKTKNQIDIHKVFKYERLYSDRPQIRKVNNIGDPDICLNCPYPTCKRGSCDRTVGMKRKKVL